VSRHVFARVLAMCNCCGLSFCVKFDFFNHSSPMVLSVWRRAQSNGSIVPSSASVMRPTTAAKNSSVLSVKCLWWEGGMGNRHARPLDEKPPIPCSQASVLYEIVGDLCVNKFMDIPV